MKATPQAIKKVLKAYKKDFDKQIQRSELLRRNKLFLEEYNGFKGRIGDLFFKVKGISRKKIEAEKDDNILLKLNYPPVDYDIPDRSKKEFKEDIYFKDSVTLDEPNYPNPSGIKEEIRNKLEVLRRYTDKWEEFCERWHIEPEWNGDTENLEKYLRKTVEIYQDWDYDIQRKTIFIRINDWTTMEDIKAKWIEIENLQNELWGKKESRANFGRDLVWYDLVKKCNLKSSEIAEIWAKTYPVDIDLLTIRRFKKEIKSSDLGGRVLDDNELLKEIKAGFLSDKYKKFFEEERDFYLTGRIKKGAKYVTIPKPFVDVVKKAVKRMESQVAAISMPPLPEDRAPFGPVPQRIR